MRDSDVKDSWISIFRLSWQTKQYLAETYPKFIDTTQFCLGIANLVDSVDIRDYPRLLENLDPVRYAKLPPFCWISSACNLGILTALWSRRTWSILRKDSLCSPNCMCTLGCPAYCSPHQCTLWSKMLPCNLYCLAWNLQHDLQQHLHASCYTPGTGTEVEVSEGDWRGKSPPHFLCWLSSHSADCLADQICRLKPAYT